jgi:hypothetical protein
MKTIDEAARSHDHNRGLNDISSVINKSTIRSFKAGVMFAQKWISIKDELPDDFTSVLVRDNSVSPIRSTALFRHGKFYPDFLLKHEDVTHWRLIELLP